jgi:serine/threonine-protein kinase PknK
LFKDPFVTERDLGDDLVVELEAAGFADAREVGRGGCGVVYRCSQVQFQRVVAVKLLTEEFADSRARFVREQQAMGRLTGHPNIVAVLDVGETKSGHAFLVMPYYQCGSIHQRISQLGLLPVEEVLRLGVKMAGALESAHGLGILHRDVKPANILVTDYGQPALGDFGIARVSGGFSTAVGTFAGSPAFTAPEVSSGQAPTIASDVYSLGATLFAALTGHAAFERRSGEHVMAQFLRIASEPIPDLRERGADDDIADVIGAAMARDPSQRPSMLQLGNQLQALQTRRGLAVDEMALPGNPLPSALGELFNTSSAATGSSSVRRAASRLPAPLDSFVGRATEMAELHTLFTQSRLVTLTGIGGVGKTTLAIHAARAAMPEFGDGVWLVELADLREGALLTDVVAAALGVRDHPGRALDEVLIDFLIERHALVVLDNCEHLIDDAAKLAETLLSACPHLHILATSREVLDIGGEAVLPLPTLAAPDAADDPTVRTLADYAAVTLFVDRARAAAPGFTLTEHNSAAVARICSCLDGLPLAIEMAAAGMRVMSAQQIADGLSDRYGLLSRRRRSTPTRQQTLAACIDWSYDLCTPAEQHLWSRLSVFAGSFDMPAARDICGENLHNLECTYLLSSLVDKSILIRTEHDGTVRFRLLETVREYGLARLTHTDDYPVLRRRHASWYQHLSTDAEAHWFGPQQLQLVRRLTIEMPNIREALHFSLTDSPATAVDMTAALRPFWVFHTMLGEGGQWTRRALAATPPEACMQRIRALFAAAHVAHIHSDLATAVGWFAELHELLEVVEAPVIRGLLTYLEGYTGLLTGDIVQARECFQRALATTDDFEVQAECLQLMGILELVTGDADSALAWSEKGLALAEARGDWVIRGVTLLSVGVACWRLGHLERAEQLLHKGLRLSLESNSTYVIPNLLEILAWIMDSRQQSRPAVVLMAAAAEVSAAIGAPLIAAHLGPFHTDCEAHARERLSAEEFQTAWDDGAAFTAERAAAFALGTTTLG